jgi:hypothetical protein
MAVDSLPIGGYFELTLPASSSRPYSNAKCFQSARAAFYALILSGKPSRVWMPTYICDSMLSPLVVGNTEIVFYNIDLDLSVPVDLKITEADWLFYVNYFGVCNKQEELLLKRFDSNQLIFDHSQAFFSPPQDCLATIYSPRKFFGVPDGGLLITSMEIAQPTEIDAGSIDRCLHLLKRLDFGPQEGYQNFKDAEKTLNDFDPRAMSSLTNHLLNGIDYFYCKTQRNINFRFLDSKLNHVNQFKFDLAHVDGPMCYPLLVDDITIRDRLLMGKVFVPTYWPELFGRFSLEENTRKILDRCLPLPCDHRYLESEMQRIVALVEGF